MATKKATPKKAAKPARPTGGKASAKPVAKSGNKAVAYKKTAPAPKKASKPTPVKAKVTPKGPAAKAPAKPVKSVPAKAAKPVAATKKPAPVVKKEAPVKLTKGHLAAEEPVKRPSVEAHSQPTAKAATKPLEAKTALKEPVKPVKLVVPKTTTDKKIKYEPDFTRSVLDSSKQDENKPSMRYSDAELAEFRDLINRKLDVAKKELLIYRV